MDGSTVNEQKVLSAVGDEWVSAADVHDATGVAQSTCRAIMQKYAGRGLLDERATAGPRNTVHVFRRKVPIDVKADEDTDEEVDEVDEVLKQLIELYGRKAEIEEEIDALQARITLRR